MEKEGKQEGYIAFVEGTTDRAIHQYWSGDRISRTITNDIDKMTVYRDRETAQLSATKFKKDNPRFNFEIKKIEKVVKITLQTL